MLTFEDCVALAELTAEEVAAIAAHEHVPEIIAAELGNYLVHDPHGVPRIRRIIVDDIAHARARGDTGRGGRRVDPDGDQGGDRLDADPRLVVAQGWVVDGDIAPAPSGRQAGGADQPLIPLLDQAVDGRAGERPVEGRRRDPRRR